MCLIGGSVSIIDHGLCFPGLFYLVYVYFEIQSKIMAVYRSIYKWTKKDLDKQYNVKKRGN